MELKDSVIATENLCKEFYVGESGKGFIGSVKALFNRRGRTIHALDSVNFCINRGEFVGYVGENGAGKSTTIKILTGILVPTSGMASVNGIVPYENRVENAKRIGVVFGQRTQLWWDLPVRESYEMLRVIFRVSRNDFTAMMKKISKTLDIDSVMDMPVRKLSLGQRMRCDLAAALIHRPSVLFLDEPTIGLDVLAKENIRNFLAEMNKTEGATIILTTHDMNDIERLCKRLIILDKGRAVFDGEMDDLKKRFVSGKVLEVEFHEYIEKLPELPELSIIREKGNKKWLKFENKDRGIAEIIGSLAGHYPVKDLSVREPSVESIIRSIYKKTVLLPNHFDKAEKDVDKE